MEAATDLIRKVVRGFYDNKAVIVLEAILMHHVLSEKELIGLMGLPAKDLRSVCARLKEDHLIKEVSSKGDITRDHRANTQVSYYIHFTEAVDAVKWKIHSINNKLKKEMDAQHNPQDLVCDVCGKRYNTLDVVQFFNPEMDAFPCEQCGNPLREDEGPSADEKGAAEDKMGALMVQLRPFINALSEIDDLSIPENTYQHEQSQAIPLPGEDDIPTQITPEKDDGIAIASSSRHPAQNVELKINFTSEEETEAKRKAAAAEKKQANALPEWHVRSTVGNDTYGTSVVPKKEEIKEEIKLEAKTKEEDASNLDAFYKNLKTEQGEEEEEEEEDEFEDVM